MWNGIFRPWLRLPQRSFGISAVRLPQTRIKTLLCHSLKPHNQLSSQCKMEALRRLEKAIVFQNRRLSDSSGFSGWLILLRLYIVNLLVEGFMHFARATGTNF